MKHIIYKIGENRIVKTISEMVETTRYLWYIVGVIAIVFLIIAHYGLMGFHLGWFLFFEMPLYVFICWVFYAIYKMHKRVKQLNKADENRN